MTTWWTADLHLGHARINELAHRPFGSTIEMNLGLMENWNARVAPEDDVWVLGDMCMGTLAESLDLVRELNGTKFLVPGNHDRVSSCYPGSDAKKALWRQMYQDVGLIIMPEHIHARLGDFEVNISHFPYRYEEDPDRYAGLMLPEDGRFLIHGHVHTSWAVRGRQINVGVDVRDYAPVSTESLLDILTSAAIA